MAQPRTTRTKPTPLSEARVNRSVHPLLLEDSPSCPNLYANRLVIVLLVTNVLLVNLLIAMFRCPPCRLAPSTSGALSSSVSGPDLPGPPDLKLRSPLCPQEGPGNGVSPKTVAALQVGPGGQGAQEVAQGTAGVCVWVE